MMNTCPSFQVQIFQDTHIDTYNVLTSTIDKYQLLQHFQQLVNRFFIQNPLDRFLKINYLIIISSKAYCLQSIIASTQYLRKWSADYKLFKQISNQISVTLIPFQERKQADDHIMMLKQIASSEFEKNYVKLTQQVEKNAEEEALHKFCREQFEWSEQEVRKFMNIDGIKTFENLLRYNKYRPTERVKLVKLKKFVDFIIDRLKQ